jgi:hypothetical protein
VKATKPRYYGKPAGHGFHVKQIALMFGTPVRTFNRRMKNMGISVRERYSNISLADLEKKVPDISNENNQ